MAVWTRPNLFSVMFITLLDLERVMECSRVANGVTAGGIRIKDIRYADDVDLLAERERDLQCLVVFGRTTSQ